jgi:streptomycin 6-kinase
MSTNVKRSTEYGWLVIDRAEFNKMRGHDYAGYEPDGVTAWVLSRDASGATVLYKGVEIVDADA